MAERWSAEALGAEGNEPEPRVENPDGLLHEYVDRPEPPTTVPGDTAGKLEWAFLNSPEIERYRASGTTIEDVEAGSRWLERALQQRGVGEEPATGVKQQHTELVSGIEESVHRYAQTVRGFKLARRGEGSEYRTELGNRDQARHVAHDTYIGSLRTYNRFMSATLHREHELEAPEWTLFGEKILPPKTTQRTGARQASEEWALTTDYYLRARELVQHLREQGKAEQGVEPAPDGAEA